MQQRDVGWSQTQATAVRTQPFYKRHMLYKASYLGVTEKLILENWSVIQQARYSKYF